MLGKYSKLRIAFTGGGTGGHIYPCLALAEVLHYDAGVELFYIANANKLEAKLLSPESEDAVKLKDYKGNNYSSYIKFCPIKAKPLPRSKNPLELIGFACNFFAETFKAKAYLQEHKIDAVFGTGGYVSGPVFAAAQLIDVPYIIHNLDASIGLANKLFVKAASVLTLGIEDLGVRPKSGRVEVTGNPISRSFSNKLDQSQKQSSDGLQLLVTGGSQGAKVINDAIGQSLEYFKEQSISVIHVTGPKIYDAFCAIYPKATKQEHYELLAYTHDMPKFCAQADVAICRAGAMTIAEMLASKTIPIFIPLSWSAHDHQNKNARSLVEAGMAFSIDERDKSSEELAAEVQAILTKLKNDPELVANMKAKISEHAGVHASDELAKLVMSV